MKAVKAVYQNGKIKLSEKPADRGPMEVVVVFPEPSRNSMPFSSGRVLIKVAQKDSAKAWALLVRHSPGMALPDQTFLVAPQAVQSLRRAGVRSLVIFAN